MHVLIVDDNKVIRTIIRKVLEDYSSQFEFSEAADGAEALTAASTLGKIDLVILDWLMPVMDGLAFTRKFRVTRPNTPILMVTTEAGRDHVVDAMRAGVSAYMVKPFSPAELISRLQNLFQRLACPFPPRRPTDAPPGDNLS